MLALAFSGGKDSLACWYLTRERDPLVMWVNTGKAYPETLAVVRRIAAQSRFVEVRSDQASQNALHGLPSDIVPIDWTVTGMTFTGEKSVKVQSYLQCCHDNLWLPLTSAMAAHGVTTLIRGQRGDDTHRAPVAPFNGVHYEHPIEGWTREDVLAYLRERGDVPEHFVLDHSSMDCYDCTAYAAHARDRMEWAAERHPQLHSAHMARLNALRSAIQAPMEALRGLS